MYFVNRLFDTAAMNIRQMALVDLMYRLSDSSIMIGMIVLLRVILILLLTLPGELSLNASRRSISSSGGLSFMLYMHYPITSGITSNFISVENPAS
jgi:hypothetical protein